MKLKLLLIIILHISLNSFSQRLEEVAMQKMDELNALIDVAEAAQIDATKEKMGIRIAEVYLVCANWDEDNKAVNEAEFTAHNSIPTTVRPKPSPAELAELIPDYQREEVIKVLDQGIAKLTKLIDGTETRKATPEILWDQLKIEGNRITQNGVPVFLNDWSFKGDEVGGHSLKEYFGNFGNYFINLGVLRKNSDDEIVVNPALLSTLNNTLESGNFGSPFLGQASIPAFIRNEYPDIIDGRSEFTGFDIDHPIARDMHVALFRDLIPIFKGKNMSKLGYMLTNEPHWNTSGTWSIVDISARTRGKFKEWLIAKHGSLANVNSLWGSSFATFEAATNSIQTPIDVALQGSPKWFDFMRFNQNRVTNWFQFLSDEIKVNDPDAKTHIKLISDQWSGNSRDHGLDFEALTALSDIHGNDASMRNSVLWGSLPWQDSYTMGWTGAVMMYDFMNSINPGGTNFNSEAHFLTTTRFSDSFLEASYARASHWLVTMHGLDAARNWVWLRDSDGSFMKENFVHSGTVGQQPGILNEIHSTIMDLNTYGEEISLLQEVETPLRIFYSETSAINKGNHMTTLSAFYESMYFEGFRLGFATENIIKNQNNADWEIISVNKTEFVTLSELEALQSYLDNGGTIIKDNLSLLKDEYGRNHTVALNTNSGGRLITAGNVARRSLDVLNNRGYKPLVAVNETNGVSNEFKGVTHRSVTLANGKNVISLVNLGLTTARIALEIDGNTNVTIKNLLTGVFLDNNFEIASEEVLFLEVNNKTLSVDDASNSVSNLVKIFPNPFTNEFFVNLNSKKNLEYQIISITGALLQEGRLNKSDLGVQKITVNTLASGVYFFKIKNSNTGQSEKVVKLIKK